MNKNKLTGWKNVFSFTFVQTVKSKSFKSSTIIMVFVVIALMLGINVFSAFQMNSQEDVVWEENQTNNIDNKKSEFAHTIYLLDDTELGFSKDVIQEYLNQNYQSLTIVLADRSHEDMVAQIETENSDTAYLHLGLNDSGLGVELYLPTNSIYEREGENVCYTLVSYIDEWKDEALGLTEEQREFLSSSITTTVNSDDDTSIVETLVKMYVPMFMCLLLYICINLYGQMVGTSVATEKSSKVMELLLTSVRPLAIIVGKVLSMMVLSLLQILGYVLLALIGNQVGTMIGQSINPDYTNVITQLLTEFDLMSIFSPVRLLLALVVFILGFTFYCTLAGLMGATVNRGEDLSSAMSVYTTISVLGFFLAYFPSILGIVNVGFQAFAAIFPLSSPFILPASILIGDLSWGTIAAGIAVLAIVVVLFLLVVAKIYEMVILYSGNKVRFKEMKKFLHDAKATNVN